MSHVADIILITSGVEHDYQNGGWLVDRLNEYLQKEHDVGMARVDGDAGGDKGFQANVWMSAINYLNIAEFVALFRSLRWQLPDLATLLIKDEHDDSFTLYPLKSV